MQKIGTVAIVGVGLIGGSIGLALRRLGLADEIVGIGRRATSLRKARQHGTVDRTTTDLERGVSQAELVVVCTPVNSIVPLIIRIGTSCRSGSLITDAASTKAEIVSSVDRQLNLGSAGHAPPARFVGSHPLAGDHRTGPEHARADLFEGHTVILTPTRNSRSKDVARLRQFWSALGSEVVTMSAREHDRALASTSHLPHLMASAISASTPRGYLPLVASGWLDTTRVAAGDPQLWCEILLSNRKHVLDSLSRVEKTINLLRASLENEDSRKLQQLLSKAKKIRDALGS